ncbi:MAG: PilT/PilU family type 4a pilus ATPase [Clostridia bacterium]|nr:PilT/PilU family type 4a pilus ATPase [Clostridia bacterium]
MQSFNDYIRIAVEKKASDVHICAGYPVSMRIDGSVVPIESEILTEEDSEHIAKSIMTPVQIETLENNGEVDFAYAKEGLPRLRMNTYKQTNSVALCARLLNDHIPKITSLGLPAELLNMVDKRRGLILVTGITGSGKSTTLASLIQEMNEKYNHHIITIEEPIEYVYPKGKSIISQREIGSDSRSFGSALRAALRQDPDVVLVGEMRDFETIQTAISAAETGHLVLSTLHTVSAAGAVDRIIDVFPQHQQQQIRAQLADVLECICSQQLIPRINGGRVVATELLFATNAIRSHIREGKTYQIPTAMETSKKLGMHLMDDCIYDLYIKGKISGELALSYAVDKDALSKKIF